jgi:hypothetical protein
MCSKKKTILSKESKKKKKINLIDAEPNHQLLLERCKAKDSIEETAAGVADHGDDEACRAHDHLDVHILRVD